MKAHEHDQSEKPEKKGKRVGNQLREDEDQSARNDWKSDDESRNPSVHKHQAQGNQVTARNQVEKIRVDKNKRPGYQRQKRS